MEEVHEGDGEDNCQEEKTEIQKIRCLCSHRILIIFVRYLVGLLMVFIRQHQFLI